MKRILITGSRDWKARQVVIDAILDYWLAEDVIVVHGACPSGADRFAKELCDDLKIPQELHPADWNKYGRSAGPRRNAEMAKLGADICLAFWDGKSNGTRNMIAQCDKNGIPVQVFDAR